MELAIGDLVCQGDGIYEVGLVSGIGRVSYFHGDASRYAIRALVTCFVKGVAYGNFLYGLVDYACEGVRGLGTFTLFSYRQAIRKYAMDYT